MGRVSFTASAPVLFAPLLSSGSNLLCSRPSALQACSVSPGVACFPFLLLSSGGLPLRHILGDCLLLQFVRSFMMGSSMRPNTAPLHSQDEGTRHIHCLYPPFDSTSTPIVPIFFWVLYCEAPLTTMIQNMLWSTALC
ncbi:uncharacterized protein LOC120640442 isoform X15 [Panicum virgatum]|uniref:uncharacterized protein LOC120640442 isoform X15 n=1 Tax=Panicum virgatum TaxID=38727 RepID=UPI0019D662E0|nr:uncharacterized protein LOC120640442 isoform X15 [Panicum virgatum]